MKIQRNIVIATFFVLCVSWLAANAIGQTGTAPAAKNPMVGRWKSEIAVIEIRADGSMTINDQEFLYKIKDGVIAIGNKDGVETFPFALDGDTLTVKYQGRDLIYTRLKGKDAVATKPPTGPAATGERVIPEFVGKWCYLANLGGTSSYRNDKCFVLYQNGTYEFSGEVSSSGAYGSSVGSQYDSGRWSATASSLTVYSQKYGKIVYPIQLRNHPKTNDPMIVVDGDNYVTQTQRRPW